MIVIEPTQHPVTRGAPRAGRCLVIRHYEDDSRNAVAGMRLPWHSWNCFIASAARLLNPTEEEILRIAECLAEGFQADRGE